MSRYRLPDRTLWTEANLANLADDDAKLSAVVQPMRNRQKYGPLELTHGVVHVALKFAANPDAGGYVALYLLPAYDGTNYAYGDESATPAIAPNQQVATLAVSATTAVQRLNTQVLELPAAPFKLQLVNKAGQALAATGSSGLLVCEQRG